MRCLNHPGKESSGYCPNCGDFFCEECLVACDDGRSYCERCRAKLGKRAEKTGTGKLSTKLLVKFKDGKQLQGTTYKIDPSLGGFNVLVHNAAVAGDERYIQFDDLKYVSLVKSLEGEAPQETHEYQPKGSEVEIAFQDGEVLRGYTLKHYNEREARFSVIPASAKDNRISTLVERSAIARIKLGRIPKAQELRSLADNSVKRLILHYYWQHPDAIMTLDDFAAKLGRSAAVIDRELDVFEREGLLRRSETYGRKQLRFVASK